MPEEMTKSWKWLHLGRRIEEGKGKMEAVLFHYNKPFRTI